MVYSFNEIIFINRKNEPLPHTIRIWMNFIDITLSKKHKTKKEIYDSIYRRVDNR